MTISKILIVDDSPTEALFMSDLLGVRRASAVSVAGNSDQARPWLEAEPFDLILMDVVMPGQNGYQTTRAIKRDDRFKDIPVIDGAPKQGPRHGPHLGMRAGRIGLHRQAGGQRRTAVEDRRAGALSRTELH